MLFLDIDCGGEGILRIIRFVWILIDYVKFIVPIGLIIMVMVDFAKSVIAGREDDMKKNVNIVIKRIIYAMVIFFVPTIVQVAINLLGESGVNYAVCLNVATDYTVDLAKYRNKFESDDFGSTSIIIPDSLKKKDKPKKKPGSPSGTGGGASNGDYGKPNFNNKDAWINKNPFAANWMGQCIWFAWGRFYEIYGYSPGFTGNGNECARQLVAAHPDKFVLSTTKPKAGAIFSCRGKNHVGMVIGYDGTNITIQDGNYDGRNNSFEEAKKDWREYTYNLSDYINNTYYGCHGSIEFANPK